jgi:hypothetical protein
MVNESDVMENIDVPEAGLDALMQVSLTFLRLAWMYHCRSVGRFEAGLDALMQVSWTFLRLAWMH